MFFIKSKKNLYTQTENKLAELLIKIGDGATVKEGDLSMLVTNDDILTLWAEKLIRNLHPFTAQLPFDTQLFNKYFERWMEDTRKSARNRYTFISHPTENFRAANASLWNLNKIRFVDSLKVRFVDRMKVQFAKPLQPEIKADVLAYFGNANLLHEFGERKIIETWPWGQKETRHFLLAYMPEHAFKSRNDMKQLLRRDAVRRPITRIDFRGRLREKLELDEPIKSTRRSLNDHAKRFFEKEYLTKLRDYATIETVLDNRDLPLPTRFWCELGKSDLILG